MSTLVLCGVIYLLCVYMLIEFFKHSSEDKSNPKVIDRDYFEFVESEKKRKNREQIKNLRKIKCK